jgi:hypothetical protein
MRYLVNPLKSCPLVGTTNDPLVTPVIGMPGCTCPSWRKSIFQVYALAGSTPSSVSVAAALYVMTSPALKRPPSEGVVTRAATGLLPTLIDMGRESVEFVPSETVKRA